MATEVNPFRTQLDFNHIFQRAFNEDLDRIRVEAEVSTVVPGGVEVSITATDDNIAIRNTNNNNELEINADGSINVNLVNSPVSNELVNSVFNEILAVPSGALTTILTYTVPPAITSIMQHIDVSGDNIAKYTVLRNSVVMDVKRTMFGENLNEVFNFGGSSEDGIALAAGEVIEVEVIHNRPLAGDFNARLQVIEIA